MIFEDPGVENDRAILQNLSSPLKKIIIFSPTQQKKPIKNSGSTQTQLLGGGECFKEIIHPCLAFLIILDLVSFLLLSL